MDEPGLFLDHTTRFKYALNQQVECLRPYHVENTGSRPITEVKQRRARLVLGWVTASKYQPILTKQKCFARNDFAGPCLFLPNAISVHHIIHINTVSFQAPLFQSKLSERAVFCMSNSGHSLTVKVHMQ